MVGRGRSKQEVSQRGMLVLGTLKDQSLSGSNIIKKLAKMPEIRWVSTTTGRFDVIALARFRSNYDFSEFMTKVLARLDGVKSSETFVCLDIKKGHFTL